MQAGIVLKPTGWGLKRSDEEVANAKATAPSHQGFVEAGGGEEG